ncbi:MAG: hypothetical protein RLZZ306_1525 [Bacteroidota bacterium]|jgi:hypothetical protein
MNVIVQKIPYIFKKIKTYSAEEILKAGGTTEFGKKTGYNSEMLKNIPIESILTEEEYQEALKKLTK